MPVKSHKVQLEARHSSKQSDFERDFEGKASMVEGAFEGKRSMLDRVFEGKRSILEQCFRALSSLEARSSSDFERSVASKKKKHARALVSSAQSPSDAPKSKLEQ